MSNDNPILDSDEKHEQDQRDNDIKPDDNLISSNQVDNPPPDIGEIKDTAEGNAGGAIEDFDDSADHDASQSISVSITNIDQMLTKLHNDFQSKLRYDKHKDEIIDKLHKEVQQYKNDLLGKLVRPIMLEVINVIDDNRKLVRKYLDQSPEELDAAKLLKLLVSFPEDLEDVLFMQGVEPFVCNEEAFDPSRQKILKVVDTMDKELDKKIAESVKCGYIQDGKVLRSEIVTVYKLLGLAERNEAGIDQST